MEYYSNRLRNGASQAQPAGGGGSFWNFEWLSNLFSGFQFPSGGFNLPTNQGTGNNLQPISSPDFQNNQSNINPLTVGLVVIGAIVLIKLINK
jgi:hypothetical protein